MTDETKRVILSRTVIDDTEAQMAGDVETPWVELPEQTSAPALPTDKASCLLYVLAADHRLRAKLSNGTVLDLTLAGSAPLTFKGAIAAAADFPTAALVESGWTYRITSDVTDNDGTKTNTGQSFLAGSTIAWNGANWTDMGEELTATRIAATPATLGQGDVLAMVDTVAIGAPSVVNLPAASATRVGKTLIVADVTGGAGINPIAVTPNGTDMINGINAAFNLPTPFGSVTFTCVQVGAGPAVYAWVTIPRFGTIEVKESGQHLPVAETLRSFRAKGAGRIIAAHAEVGTAAGAGESMTFDVQIGGVSCLNAAIAVTDATAIDTPVHGVINTAACTFAANQLVTVVRAYVPGAGTLRDSVCGIRIENL